MKRIVVYYSQTENTKEAAETIAKSLDCKTVRITTKKEMPKGTGGMFMIGGMQATFGMKPAINTDGIDFDEYEEIILGTPIWANKCVPAINTFLDDERIREKVTGAFTSSGGGDNDKCMEILRKKLPNLKYEVALADRRQPVAAKNAEKLEKFISEMKE